jgi:hypothetical protein
MNYGPLNSHPGATVWTAEHHGLRGLQELTTFNLPPLQREHTSLDSNPRDRQQMNYGPLISHARTAMPTAEHHGLRGLQELTTFNLPPPQRKHTSLIANPGDRQQMNYGPLTSHPWMLTPSAFLISRRLKKCHQTGEWCSRLEHTD